VHIESDFLVPIRYGDEPDIHLGILEMGTTSVKFGYWMTREGEDRPLCRARITTVSVNMATFAKQPIPDKWREAFAQFVIDESEYPG
jgi:acyl-CoA thioesterase FadM